MSKKAKVDYNNIFAVRLRELLDGEVKGSKTFGTKTAQKKVADEIGIARQTLSQYADGSVRPNTDVLKIIADYFNVSADYLVGISDDPTRDTNLKALFRNVRISSESHLMLLQYAPLEKKILDLLIKRGYMQGILSKIADTIIEKAMFNMALEKGHDEKENSKNISFGAWEVSQYLSERYHVIYNDVTESQKELIKKLAMKKVYEIGDITKIVSENWATMIRTLEGSDED